MKEQLKKAKAIIEGYDGPAARFSCTCVLVGKNRKVQHFLLWHCHIFDIGACGKRQCNNCC